MNGSEIITMFRDQLSESISNNIERVPKTEPIAVSPWVAMALLQKAIRRGEERLALGAAASLLRNAPNNLWRRLCGIAFEDIGLADLETLSLVTAAIGGKRVRAKMGGEWPVASYLITSMIRAPKCRAADDLLMTAEMHPEYERERLRLTFLPTDELLHIATGEGDVICRALAAWYAVGTHSRSTTRLRPRAGCPAAFFDHLCEVGMPHTLVEISREGFRRGAEALCPFVSLLFRERREAETEIRDDVLPPEILCGSVPSWCLDIYSWEGKAALQRFLESNAETARWVRSHVTPAAQVKFLGGIVFRVEGGLMRRRERWPLAEELRRKMEIESNLRCSDASEILDLARADIGLLNEARYVR